MIWVRHFDKRHAGSNAIEHHFLCVNPDNTYLKFNRWFIDFH